MKLNKTSIKNHKNYGFQIYEINKGIFNIHLRKKRITKNDPDLYIVDVFASFIKDNSKAYQEDLSDVFDELYQAIEYLEEVLYIPKRITKQIKGI